MAELAAMLLRRQPTAAAETAATAATATGGGGSSGRGGGGSGLEWAGDTIVESAGGGGGGGGEGPQWGTLLPRKALKQIIDVFQFVSGGPRMSIKAAVCRRLCGLHLQFIKAARVGLVRPSRTLVNHTHPLGLA